MKPLNQTGFRQLFRRLRGLLCAFALVIATGTAFASPINTSDPLGFFTNVASRLLSSQLNVNLTHIQVYPTNQYTPAVHRLLQVTANIYDATTTNFYPSVFRPLFWKTNELNGSGILQTDVYVAGYQYVPEPLSPSGPVIFSPPTDAGDPSIPFGLSITNNIYDVPWVLGVKKGLPNFNALELDNCFFIERRLQFNRNSSAPSNGPFPFGRTYTTNQMYVMGISNSFAAEDWNSYAENYNNQVTIVAQDELSVGLTNGAGVTIANAFVTNGIEMVSAWPGESFILPFGTNTTVPQNLGFIPLPSPNNLYVYYYTPSPVELGGYIFQGPCFIPQSSDPSNFLDNGILPLPHFGLTVTNHLWAYILDTDSNGNVHLLDYVQLGSMNNSLDVSSAIADPNNSGLWSTNTDYDYSGGEPYGVNIQYLVSSIGGTVPIVDNDGGIWTTTPVPGSGGQTAPQIQQAYFSAFFSASDEAPYGGEIVSNLSLSVPAPFSPTRTIVQRMVYQANDPLVHYLTSDLNDFADDASNRVSIATPPPGIKYIGQLSDRYMPWGVAGNLAKITYENVPPDSNPYNLAYKDPSVMSADSWAFPTNESLNASWLGQVHRGTPWQTIFLKSTNILSLVDVPFLTGFATWQLWTGDLNPADAASMAPAQDWHVASLLASLFNTNTSNYASLFSVNDGNSSDWDNLLNGMTVLTNDLNDFVIEFTHMPQFTTIAISSNSTQAATIASAIESTRGALPLQLFTDKGDIFSVPQLSDASPYLNVDLAQVQHGISDQAYEAIPSQLLPLLRTDSIGSVTNNGQMVIQFTGDDGHVYAVQTSCDLAHWTSISTNCPINGVFTYTNTVAANKQFYRTVFLQ